MFIIAFFAEYDADIFRSSIFIEVFTSYHRLSHRAPVSWSTRRLDMIYLVDAPSCVSFYEYTVIIAHEWFVSNKDVVIPSFATCALTQHS